MNGRLTIEIMATAPLHSPMARSPLVDSRYRASPRGGAGLPGQPLVGVATAAWETMHRHTASRTEVEVGGMLVGQFGRDERGEFVVVEAAIPALQADGSRGFLRVTANALVAVDDERERAHPDLRIVGWYHSHPSFGIFLSGIDLHTHATVFREGPFLAIVLDPVRREEGVFGWVAGVVEGPLACWDLELTGPGDDREVAAMT